VGQYRGVALCVEFLVPRRVETSRGGITFEFPVSALTSWLCVKSDAIMLRDKPKDSYDVVWTIAAFGPEPGAAMVAASPLLSGPHSDEVRRRLKVLIDDQFMDIGSVGCTRRDEEFRSCPGRVDHLARLTCGNTGA
jgi:hypothetical protein